jgi:glucan phosphoethanolaminetransferase (alkaline phosphatase superfamily)
MRFTIKAQELVKQKEVAAHFQGLINNFGEVLRYLGIGLLVLGGLSAISLLFLAVISPERLSKVSKTLWSLFFITLLMGFVVLSFAK